MLLKVYLIIAGTKNLVRRIMPAVIWPYSLDIGFAVEDEEDDPATNILFLVKWQGYSHLHSELP